MKKTLFFTFLFIAVFAKTIFAQSVNTSLSLTGANDYAVINSACGMGVNNVTVECWVYVPTTSEKGCFVHLGGDGVDAGPGYNANGYGIGVGDGTWYANGNELIVLIAMVRWIDPNVTIGTGWHHIAFSINASNQVEIYKDGVSVYTEGGTPTVANALDAKTHIGTEEGVGQFLTTGKIDNLRFWDDLRTDQEITDNYAVDLVGNEANLRAYYKMNETSGATLNDETSNNYDMTIYGASYYSNDIVNGIPNGGSCLELSRASSRDAEVANCFAIGTTNLTMECWAYVPSTSELGTFIKIGNGTDGYAVGVGSGTCEDGNSGNEFIALYEGVRWIDPNISIGTGWHHLAMVVDGSGYCEMYLDGKKVLDESSGVTPNAPTGQTTIGSSNQTRYVTNGKIDEVRIWNTARTEAQIKANMYRELSGSEANLVSYYKMNTGSGSTLENEAGSDMTINNASWKASGCFAGSRKAVTLDGTDDYISVANSANLQISSAVTISAWINASAWKTNSWEGSIISKEDYTTQAYGYTLRCGNNGILDFLIGANDGNWKTSTSAAFMSTNKWYHVAGTYDGTTMKTYINGVQVASFNYSGSIGTSTQTLNLGRSPEYTDRLFQGTIDEVQVWNVALTEAQLREVMMKNLIGDETGLVAYYRLDEEEGTTAYDLTANANNGTLTNGPTVAATSTAFNYWIGGTSTAWATASNWSANTAPASTDNIGLHKWSVGNTCSLSGNPTVNNLFVSTNYTEILGSQFTANANLIVNGSPTTYGSNTTTTVTGYTAISSGATLNVGDGSRFTASSDIKNNGTLTLKSSSTSNSSLLDNGIISGSGTFKYEQYFSGAGGGTPNGRMFYVSPSTASSTSNVFDAADTDKLWSYSEASNGYTEITDNATSLNSMQGYVARLGANSTVSLTGGAFNTGNKSKANLSRTGVVNATRGFHLLGNPYPSYVSWEDATKTNLRLTFWYRTHNATNMVYDSYNADNNTGTNNNLGGAVNEFIAPNQAFWVRVNADGVEGQLDFTNSMRSHKNQKLMKSEEVKPNTFRFSLHETANQSKDETIIIFDNQAAEDFDSWDSEKMFSTNIAQCYTSNNGGEMVMNSMLPFAQTKTVPVGIQITASGEHQFKADLTDFDPSMIATLEDKLNNSFTEMFSNTVYTFTADAGTNNDRFVLHFGFMATDIKNQANANSSTYAYEKSVYINSLSEGTIEITDLSGRIILSQAINSGMNKVKLNTAGVYMVKMINRNEVRVSKIVIN